MEFFTKAFAQLQELYRSLSPGARFMAGGLLVVVLACGAWIYGGDLTGSEVYLLGDQLFSSTQLRDMQSAFGKAGLSEYHVEGARVRVPRAQQSKYMAALAEANALPVDFGEYLSKAANNSEFLPTSGARQQAQAKVALQSELQLDITRMNGIEKAFVHIAEETGRGFPHPKSVTASVGVQPRGSQAIDEQTVAAIKSIVAHAWPGLKPESVTVVDLSRNRLFPGTSGENAGSGAVGDYANFKKGLELDWQEKITRLLGIPGTVVTANVELEAEARRPKRVSLSVAVPSNYYEAIWRKQNSQPPGFPQSRPTPETLAAIEQVEAKKMEAAIVPLLGPAEPGVDRASQLAISSFHPIEHAPHTPLTPEKMALEWAEKNWQALGVGGLILVGLLVLRSALKPNRPVPAAPQAAAPETGRSLFLVTEDDLEPMAEEPHRDQAPLAAGPPDALREELIRMVRQDPQAAASVLRTWIGNAS